MSDLFIIYLFVELFVYSKINFVVSIKENRGPSGFQFNPASYMYNSYGCLCAVKLASNFSMFNTCMCSHTARRQTCSLANVSSHAEGNMFTHIRYNPTFRLRSAQSYALVPDGLYSSNCWYHSGIST